MNYQKAMNWARKHPTGGKPQYMGFSSCSSPRPSMWTNPRFVALKWFEQRHSSSEGAQYCREAIREKITEAREMESAIAKATGAE